MRFILEVHIVMDSLEHKKKQYVVEQIYIKH